MTDVTPEEEQDLVALVDGRLDPERRAALERRAREDPRLAAAIADQRAAVVAIAGAVEQVSAPLALRTAVERLQTAPPRRTLRRRLGSLAWLAPAAVAAASLLAIVVFRGGGPDVDTVVAAALRPAVASVVPVGVESRVLREQVDGVPFPNYAGKFGRSATGQRTDEFDGRPTRTVFYEGDLAYTIVGGRALEEPEGAQTATREGTRLKTFTDQGRTVVTWRRRGHTCVLSSRRVPRETLLELAVWRGQGAIPF
jgi:anti-sigma factor RsiW